MTVVDLRWQMRTSTARCCATPSSGPSPPAPSSPAATPPYAGRVPVVFWFCWSDAMVPSFGLLGLLTSGGAAKAAYTRYQSIAGPW